MNKLTNTTSALLNTVFLGAGFYVGMRYLISEFNLVPSYLMGVIMPAHMATYYSTIESINTFSNSSLSGDVYAQTIASVAVGCMLFLVLTPYLLIKMGSEKNKGEMKGVLSGSVLLALSLVFIVPALTSGYHYFNNDQKNREQTVASMAMDELRQYAIDLAFNAAEQMLMPTELGGGDGSFTSFNDPNGNTRTIRIEDIRSESNAKLRFSIQEPIQDSVLVIIGMSETKGRAPDFKNMNGDIGKAQFAIMVTPYKEDTYRIIQEFSN